MAIDTRAAAARALAAVFSGQSLNQALPALLEDVRERDRALLQQLCYGTLRSYPRLRALLELLLDKPMKSKDGDVRALLMLGIYQLEETRIPDHAAVAATVGATADLNKATTSSLAARTRNATRTIGSRTTPLTTATSPISGPCRRNVTDSACRPSESRADPAG